MKVLETLLLRWRVLLARQFRDGVQLLLNSIRSLRVQVCGSQGLGKYLSGIRDHLTLYNHLKLLQVRLGDPAALIEEQSKSIAIDGVSTCVFATPHVDRGHISLFDHIVHTNLVCAGSLER